MAIRSLRAALLVRLSRSGSDDRGSLPMLMLVIIATAALGGLMMSNVISASNTSTFAQQRVRSLAAAQSGIDAVLGQLRAVASSTNVATGDSGRLPCYTSTNPLTSNSTGAPSANDTSSTAYRVTLYYYSVDPATLDTADLNTDMPAGQRMLCSTNSGPYNPTTQVRTPKYALITSTGYGTAGSTAVSRTVQTTYNFQVLNQNIAGGQIRLFPASSSQTTQWCMDTGASPAPGTAVTIQACSTSTPPASRQVFEYRADLSIELVSSTTNPTVAGLCLDTGPNPTKHSAGNPILLEQCSVADASVCPSGYTPTSYHAAFPTQACSVSPWNQQWSVDDNAHLEGSKTDQSDIDGYCINAASQTAGVALTLATCAGTVTDPKQTWIPSPSTGAGMAGAGTSQLVNFQQFAMCLDDTSGNTGALYMILYTCKQDPAPSKIRFNQKWTMSPALGTAPTTTLITTATGGVTYCLKSPQTVGGYPVLVAQSWGGCPSSVSTAGNNSPYVWTVSQKYSDSASTSELTYANQYTIKDSSSTPLCLGMGATNDLLNSTYLKVITATCDGSNGQKWNADAIASAATLTNTNELGSNTGS